MTLGTTGWVSGAINSWKKTSPLWIMSQCRNASGVICLHRFTM